MKNVNIKREKEEDDIEEDDIEGNVIEEDDFEIINIKRENVNNFVKQSDEILYFTKFH